MLVREKVRIHISVQQWNTCERRNHYLLPCAVHRMFMAANRNLQSTQSKCSDQHRVKNMSDIQSCMVQRHRTFPSMSIMTLSGNSYISNDDLQYCRANRKQFVSLVCNRLWLSAVIEWNLSVCDSWVTECEQSFLLFSFSFPLINSEGQSLTATYWSVSHRWIQTK